MILVATTSSELPSMTETLEALEKLDLTNQLVKDAETAKETIQKNEEARKKLEENLKKMKNLKILNLNNNFKNLVVSTTATFDRKNMSGQSSKSDVSDKGSKPKKISVSAQISMDECKDLKTLLLMGEDLDETNNPVIYKIIDETCRAMMIREVIFVDSFKCKKNSSLQCFDISFSLQEKESIAERREKRTLNKKAPKVAVIAGNTAQINAAIKTRRITSEGSQNYLNKQQ